MDYLFWRCFIHQCSAAGHIVPLIKPATFGASTSIQGAYAQVKPTSKGRNSVKDGETVLLPQLNVCGEKINNTQVG